MFYLEMFPFPLDLPDTPPTLSYVQPAYLLHQEVRFDCTSPLSKPPAEINFYVNNEPVICLQSLIRKNDCTYIAQ